MTEPKPTLITLVDQQLLEEKQKLLSSFDYKQSYDDIDKLAKHIRTDIKNLSKVIQSIIDKHHRDYISTFSSFMDAVRTDLKSKLERMDKITEEKKHINDLKSLRCELDFFRKESIRMHSLSKHLSSKIDDMSLRMKILTDEVNSVTLKWRESEMANKQLITELEKNIHSHKELQDELYQMKEYVNQMNSNNIKDDEVYNNNYNEYKERSIALVEKYKEELKREKIKNSKLFNEMNQMVVEKNKVESIFIDCVEETRKAILNRRLKEKIGKYSKGKKSNVGKDLEVNVQYEMFLPKDKREILERFLFNDEVSRIVREALVVKPKRTEETRAATSMLVSKVELNSGSPTNRTTNGLAYFGGFGKGFGVGMSMSMGTQNGFYHTMGMKQQQGLPRLVNSLSQKSINSTMTGSLAKRFGY